MEEIISKSETQESNEQNSVETGISIPKSIRDKYVGLSDEDILIAFCNDSEKRTSYSMSQCWSLWDKYDDYWDGEQKRPDKGKKRWRDDSVLNKIYTYGEQKVALLTDVRPSFSVYAQNDDSPEANDTADAINNYITNIMWVEHEYDELNEEIVRDLLKKNLGFCEKGWDEIAKNGAGELFTKYLNPKWVRWLPTLDSWKNLDLLVLVYPEEQDKLKVRYPEHAKDVVGNWDSTVFQDSGKNNSGKFELDNYIMKIATATKSLFGSKDRYESENKAAKVTRVYWRDKESRTTTAQSVDEQGNMVEESVLVYPTWRVTEIHNGVLLSDGPMKYQYLDMPPILPAFHNKKGGTLINVSTVSQEIEPQDILNKNERQLSDNIALHTNGQWLVDTRSGLSGRDVFDWVDGAIEWDSRAGGQPPNRITGEVSSSLFNISEKRREDMKEASDMTDSVQGIREQGVTAGIAIDLLQQIGQAKIRKLARSLEGFLRRCGKCDVALIKQYKTEEISHRYIGKSGKPEMLKLNVPIVDPSTGQPSVMNDVQKFDFDLVVVPNTVLPSNKRVQENRLQWMFQAGIVDDVYVLDQMDMPKRDELIQRKSQMAQMQQIIQQQQAQLEQAAQGAQMAQEGAGTPSPEYRPVQ